MQSARDEQVIEKKEIMSVIGSKSCVFSLTGYSRGDEKSSSFNSINKPSLRFPRNLGKAAVISSKISESGVGENPGTNGVSLSSKNKMEGYNTAMKRLMRSPYEYHHDLDSERQGNWSELLHMIELSAKKTIAEAFLV